MLSTLDYLWLFVIISTVVLVRSAPSRDRPRRATWFDLLPYMTVSKKSRGRSSKGTR